MSRSKEGKEDFNNEKNAAARQNEEPSKPNYLDQRLGAEGQTDYTSGRESWREYPKRSTSLRGRNENLSQSRDLDDSSSKGNYGARSASDWRPRSTGRFGRRDETNRASFDRERNDYGRSSRFDRGDQYDSESYGRYGRHSYEDLRYGRADHEDLPPRNQGRYRANERSYDYDRDSYRQERGNYPEQPYDYADPYNRETLSGRYDYDADYETRRQSYDNQQGSDLRGREANYLRCNDIMTKNVTICSPQTTLREVAEKMQDDGIGSIPVVDGGRLVGIVTDRDIVCRVIADGRDTRSTLASEAMSQDIVTCSPDDSAHDAIRKMGEHQIRRIPVCDVNGRLRGIIAMADIALEAERDRELADALERISQPTPTRSRRR
jgi:CBS domain-containing protein